MSRQKCPHCGSRDNATILFGMPAMSKQLQRDLSLRRAELGGCMMSESDPRWHCNKCGAWFGFPGERSPHFSFLEDWPPSPQ